MAVEIVESESVKRVAFFVPRASDIAPNLDNRSLRIPRQRTTVMLNTSGRGRAWLALDDPSVVRVAGNGASASTTWMLTSRSQIFYSGMLPKTHWVAFHAEEKLINLHSKTFDHFVAHLGLNRNLLENGCLCLDILVCASPHDVAQYRAQAVDESARVLLQSQRLNTKFHVAVADCIGTVVSLETLKEEQHRRSRVLFCAKFLGHRNRHVEADQLQSLHAVAAVLIRATSSIAWQASPTPWSTAHWRLPRVPQPTFNLELATSRHPFQSSLSVTLIKLSFVAAVGLFSLRDLTRRLAIENPADVSLGTKFKK